MSRGGSANRGSSPPGTTSAQNSPFSPADRSPDLEDYSEGHSCVLPSPRSTSEALIYLSVAAAQPRASGRSSLAFQSTDAAFAVLARLTHVSAVHETGGAFTASPPDGEHSVVAGLHTSNGRADARHLAEHFVPDDELSLTVRRLSVASGYLLPVGATDAHADHPDFDFILLGD
jgi:hypothetical protein